MTPEGSSADTESDAAPGGSLHIKSVNSRDDREQFIRMPWELYRGDRFWIPPLLFDRRQLLSPRNPFFEHARMQAWIAYRGSRPVGRISAQIVFSKPSFSTSTKLGTSPPPKSMVIKTYVTMALRPMSCFLEST